MAKKAVKKPVPTPPVPPIANTPVSAREWIQQGEKAEKLHDLFNARDCYDSATKLEPQNIEAWFKKGLLLEHMGNNPPGIMARQDLFFDAIRFFEQVITIDPQYKAAYIHLGQVYVQLANYARNASEAGAYAQKALTPLDKVLQLDPKQSKAWFIRAFAHLRLQQNQEALGDFIKTTENDDKNVEAWWNVGCLQDFLGNYQPALGAFEKVLKLKLNFPELDTRLQKLRIRLHAKTRTPEITAKETEALNQLDTGQKLVKQDNFPKAIQFLTSALQHFDAIDNPYGQIEALRYIALSHKALRQRDAALSTLIRLHALAIQQGNPSKIAEAAHNLGYISFQLGKFDGAIEAFSESIALYRQLRDEAKLADGLSNLGKVFQTKADYSKAIENFTECLNIDIIRKENSRQATDLIEIGDTHKLMGNLDAAKADYNKAIEIYKILDYRWKVEEVSKKLKDLGRSKPRLQKQGKKT